MRTFEIPKNRKETFAQMGSALYQDIKDKIAGFEFKTKQDYLKATVEQPRSNVSDAKKVWKWLACIFIAAFLFQTIGVVPSLQSKSVKLENVEARLVKAKADLAITSQQNAENIRNLRTTNKRITQYENDLEVLKQKLAEARAY